MANLAQLGPNMFRLLVYTFAHDMVLKQKIKKSFWEDEYVVEVADHWCETVKVWHLNRVIAIVVVAYMGDITTNRYFLYASLIQDLWMLKAMFA